MYAGQIVESGPTETVLADPKHPYTQLLLSAVADAARSRRSVSADTGEPPRVINPRRGLPLPLAVPLAIEKCAQVTPLPRPIGAAKWLATSWRLRQRMPPPQPTPHQ